MEAFVNPQPHGYCCCLAIQLIPFCRGQVSCLNGKLPFKLMPCQHLWQLCPLLPPFFNPSPTFVHAQRVSAPLRDLGLHVQLLQVAESTKKRNSKSSQNKCNHFAFQSLQTQGKFCCCLNEVNRSLIQNVSQSQKKYSQKTHPPVKGHNGKEQQ